MATEAAGRRRPAPVPAARTAPRRPPGSSSALRAGTGRRPRTLLAAVAAFWLLAGSGLGAMRVQGPATVLVCLFAVLALPWAARARAREADGTRPARLPLPLWGFVVLVLVSTALQRTTAGVQNAVVYLAFAAFLALAALWAAPGTALLLLRWLRGAALFASLGYIASVLVGGPGTDLLYPARVFGEVAWIGLAGAVPLAERSRWGLLPPLLICAAEVLSLSRTAGAVSVLLLLGLVLKGRNRGEVGRAIGLAALITGASTLLALTYAPLHDRFVHNDDRSVAGFQIGTSGRDALWDTTWASIRQAPWFGHGIGSVERLLADPLDPANLGHPHNDYLRLWHDFGLVGLLLWCAAVTLLARGAFRRRKAARGAGRDDWAVHQAALLALLGLSLNVLTTNLLVYVFVMVPVAVVVGTSTGRARAAATTARAAATNGPTARSQRTDPKEHPMDLRGFLRALARRWPTITVLTAVGLAAGLGVTALSTPQYQAESQIFVAVHATSDIAELNQGSAFSQAQVQSYADIVRSPRVTEPVVRQLGLDQTPDQLAQRVTATVRPGTVLIDITATDPVAATAAQIADAVADEAQQQIVSLETPPGASTAPVHIDITRAATPPTTAVSPLPLLDALGGLIAGLVAGIGLALLRESLDTTLRSSHDLAETTGLPVLGVVPFDRAAQQAPLAVGAGGSGRAEAIRMVRTNLQFAQVDQKPRVLVVTSALAGEGKTSVACNLAMSLAEAGNRVCLVDADLRSPSVARTFGLVQDAGLTSVLIGSATADEVLQSAGPAGLSVLTCGPMPPNPAEVLSSSRMGQVLDGLANDFDLVVVDSAPLLPVADTVGLAPLVDGAVMVVRAVSTPGDRVRAGVSAMRSVGVPVLGTVLSMAPQRGPLGYGYGYGYGYGATPPEGAVVVGRQGGRAWLRSSATAVASMLRPGE